MKKIAVVTGAGSWIGRQIACDLAKQDVEIFAVGRSLNKIKETVSLIKASGGKAQEFQVDLSSEEEVKNFANNIKVDINILVHAAAIYPKNDIEDISRKEWDEVIATNLSSSYQLAHDLLPRIPKHDGSRIIFISSVAGSVIGPRTLAAYSASKAGVDGLMKSLASELGPKGITVNSILPGNILNQERFKPDADRVKLMKDAIPVGKFGSPSDISHAVNFLVSKNAGFVNGHMLVIDGGETISNWK